MRAELATPGGFDASGLWALGALLAVNAFFVAAEFAVVSARRSQIEPLVERGRPGAKTALWAMEHATLMLAMCQLGITVASLLILNLSEPSLHQLVMMPLGLAGWPADVTEAVAFTLALIVVSYLHVVLGEMVPKNVSFSIPDRAVLVLAPPLVIVARVFRWLIVGLNAIANGALRLAGVRPIAEAHSVFTLEQVASIVSHSTREGVLVDESGALSAAFEFTAKKVRDVAVPIGRVVGLDVSGTPRDVERLVAEHGFSRYVVADGSGEPRWYVHLKDVIDLREDELDAPLPTKRLRRASSLFEGTDLEDALASMRRSSSHLARVVDENGAVIGVLFLEDILEVLVGEVRDATRRR